MTEADPMRRSAERMRVIPPIDPDPETRLVALTRRTDVDCRRRPYRSEIARGLADDHPPRLDITISAGVRVRLEVDPDMTYHQVRHLVRHLRPEVQAWLVEVAEYAHDLEMAEASQDRDGGDA